MAFPQGKYGQETGGNVLVLGTFKRGGNDLYDNDPQHMANQLAPRISII